MGKIESKIIDNSAKEIHQFLEKQYVMKTLEIEMQTHKARQTRMDNKVQRYFNSTPIRNAFSRWMVYAYYEHQFYTISYLVKEMNTNRQTVSIMINECEVEDYVIVQRKGKTVACQASSQLVQAMNEYSEWRKQLIEQTIYQPYINLKQFENWMKKQFNM